MIEVDQINRIRERIIGAAIEVHRAPGPGLLASEIPDLNGRLWRNWEEFSPWSPCSLWLEDFFISDEP